MKTMPPLLTPKIASALLNGETKISLDLGITLENVEIYDNYAILRKQTVSYESLSKIKRKEDSNNQKQY